MRGTEINECPICGAPRPTKLSHSQQATVTTILNLRKLTKETGTITTRAQNDVLRALSSTDIAAVANALAE